MQYIIGTRGSKLALTQAELVRTQLEKLDIYSKIKIIKTSGDIIRDRSLAEVGGKGLFIKEIEKALLDNEVDIAVHSMKDVPPEIKDDFKIAAVLAREEANDVLISKKFNNVTNLPENIVVGTASPRRKAFLEYYNKNIEVKLLRGNVNGRIEKLLQGEYDAIILAKAGLKRLGLYDDPILCDYFTVIPENIFIPSVGQGAIGIEIRSKDKELHNVISKINDPISEKEIYIERSVIRNLDADCFTPVGIRAKINGGNIDLKIMYFKGREVIKIILEDKIENINLLINKASKELLVKI